MFRIILFLITDAFCGLAINAKLINKRGMEHGFIIETETHFLKEFNGTKPIQFQTKNGIRMELAASFLDQNEIYGPSDAVVFQGDLFDNLGNPMKIFGAKPFVLRLGEERKFEIKKNPGQLLEITLKPEIN